MIWTIIIIIVAIGTFIMLAPFFPVFQSMGDPSEKIEKIGTDKAGSDGKKGLIAYVTPVIALFLGWAVGSEPITVFTLGGAASILGGVVLVARRPASSH